MAEQLTQTDVLAACRVLFGDEVELSEGFLRYLQPSGAKSAYRRRAKEVHPDLVAGEDDTLQRERARLFRELAQAFELLSGYLSERDRPPLPAPARSGAAPHASPRGPAPGPPPAGARGTIPRHVLEIGLYLYYRGAVTFSQLIDALLWQRRQRPVIGRIARRWGWLSDEQLQRILAGTGPSGRFGDRAVQLGLLSAFQVRTLLFFQRCQQRRLGEYFVERGILDAAELEALVDELQAHNRKFQQPCASTSGASRERRRRQAP